MKIKNVDKKKLKQLLVLSMSLLVWLLADACSLHDLSRSKAESLITQTQDFKNISSVDLISTELRQNMMRGDIAAVAADEPEPAAIERRKTLYFKLYPIAGIANRLGLVDARITRRDERVSAWSGRPLGFWEFDESYVLSDKGKKLWTDYGEQAQETVIPTAKKEFIEITGITKQGESDAMAQFNYKWVPNEFGRALDTSTVEYKNLPDDLQKSLKETKTPYGGTYEASWGDAQRGVARFRKFDDGWRIVSVVFS